jgi:hypothetical protein
MMEELVDAGIRRDQGLPRHQPQLKTFKGKKWFENHARTIQIKIIRTVNARARILALPELSYRIIYYKCRLLQQEKLGYHDAPGEHDRKTLDAGKACNPFRVLRKKRHGWR